MSISGLGSPTSLSAGAVRASSSLIGSTSTSRARTEFDNLTDSDRDLIYSVTGNKIEPGFDPTNQPFNLFAAQIAHDRTRGALGPGQDVSAAYLKQVSHQYDGVSDGANPFASPYLEKALEYLSRKGNTRLDVNA